MAAALLSIGLGAWLLAWTLDLNTSGDLPKVERALTFVGLGLGGPILLAVIVGLLKDRAWARLGLVGRRRTTQ